jgi:hypothetical protein
VIRDKIQFLDRTIDTQRNAIHFQKKLAIITVTTGLIVLCFSPFIARFLDADGAKALIGVGGGFCSSLATWPLKEIVNYRRRVVALQFLKDEYQGTPDDSELKRLDDQLWSLTGKMLEG